MRWVNKKHVKYALAGIGACYVAVFAGYLAYTTMKPVAPSGPSELEAHPERQEEILAQRRAEEMKERLGLTDDQTAKLSELFAAQRPPDGPPGPGDGDPRERWRAMQEKINEVLTPEQQQKMEEGRGQFGGRGGPFRGMTPERIESLKSKMTPEQRERFEKRIAEFQQRMQQRGRERGR